MNDDEISQFLERYGRALSAGDLPTIAQSWEMPALVLSDDGAIAVTETGEIEKFFAQAIEWYQAQGLAATTPELERAAVLSATLVAVDVRWRAFDGSGKEQSSERSHYILQRTKEGPICIRVALTMPV